MTKNHFIIILALTALISCAKKEETKDQVKDWTYQFKGNWHATKSSTATGTVTTTYTATITGVNVDMPNSIYLQPFSGTLSSPVPYIMATASNGRFQFDAPIQHGSGHANGTGVLINANTIYLDYNITYSNSSSEHCTETLTK